MPFSGNLLACLKSRSVIIVILFFEEWSFWIGCLGFVLVFSVSFYYCMWSPIVPLTLFFCFVFFSISLEETYEALRTFDILGIQEKPDISAATCKSVSEVLGSSAVLKDLFHALRVNDVLKCEIKEEIYEVSLYPSCSVSKSLFEILKKDTSLQFYF